MSSSVIRLAYVAIKRRREARRSGGITLPDLEPGPGAAEAVAEALSDVAAGSGGPALVAPAPQATTAPDTKTTRQAPPQGAALVDVDTVTAAGAIPSPITLTQRVAVARDIDSGGTVPLQLELVDATPAASRSEIAIRVLNVAIAGALLVVLSPLLLLITAAVKLTSRGPVFYKQVRVGLDRRRYRSLTPFDRRQQGERRVMRPEPDGRRVRVSAVPVERRSGADRRKTPDRRVRQVTVEYERRSGVDRRQASCATGDRRRRIAAARHDRRQWNLCGRMFTMYKFRTMRLDAESATGPVWARHGDERVTAIGGFLRACRLDELPQLYNVLKGDMNIVGPRPERPTIVVDLVNAITEYPIRQRTLPGITGLAQISQAPDGSLDDVRVKVRYDLEYLRRRSVMEDLRIMAKTPMVMFFRRSGY